MEQVDRRRPEMTEKENEEEELYFHSSSSLYAHSSLLVFCKENTEPEVKFK